MFERPDEWRGFHVLAWDDGTIEPVLFATFEAAREFWCANTRTGAQTIEVVVRELRADRHLEIKAGKLPVSN